MRDNSGNPSGVHLYSKDDRIVAYLPMNDPDTFISVLLEASKMQTATPRRASTDESNAA